MHLETSRDVHVQEDIEIADIKTHFSFTARTLSKLSSLSGAKVSSKQLGYGMFLGGEGGASLLGLT